MKLLSVSLIIALVAAALILFSYNSRHRRDKEIATEAGYEFASRFLNGELSELERQDFLLDVKAKEHLLETSYDREVADAFITAFADSALNR